jgi:drug/metabolite transporter (DMT)-like permease
MEQGMASVGNTGTGGGSGPAAAAALLPHGARAGDNAPVAIALLIVGLGLIPAMDAIAKLIGEGSGPDGLNALQLVWLRFSVQGLACLPIALAWHRSAMLRPSAPGLQVLRGLLGLCSAGFFFHALVTLPLAETLCISFVYPFVITALSPLVLGERVGVWRWSAVAAGFFGVLLIVQPGLLTGAGTVPFGIGALSALASGVLYAISILITRRVAGADPAVVTLTWTGLISLVAGAALQPLVWTPPSPLQWSLVILAGLIGTGCQFLVVLAHERAPASQLAPFGYVEVVSAVFLGLVMFGDWPVATTWIGITIIVTSGLVIAWREAVRRAAA